MSQLSISCFVYGSRDIFTIDVTPTARLSELQKLAWEEKQHLFPGLHKDHLALWKVPFDVTNDDASIDSIQLLHGEGSVTKLTAIINKRVESAIPLEDVYTHLIVIQPPPKLWCWVRGLPKDTAFKLQPFPDHEVSNLKDAIKEKMKPLFDDIPASTLVLWKVEIDNFQTEDFSVDLQEGLAGVCRLYGAEGVPSIFPELIPGHRLSIVIDARRIFQSIDTPPLGLPQGLVDIVKRRLDISRERRENYHSPPLTLGEPANFEQIQKSDETYFGCTRPLKREARLPLALIHPIFGTFIDDCKEIPLGARDNEFAQRFRDDMCEFYSREDHRRKTLCELLQDFGLQVTPAHIGSSQERTDGHIIAGKNHPIYIHELKNELGLGSAEPSFQALLYYQSFIDQFQLGKDPSTYHPCFVICVLGPHMVFAGAALTDRANMEIFSSLPLNFATDNNEAFNSLARHLAALKRALESLEKYYENLDRGTLQPTDIAQPSFPYPTSFDNFREEAISTLTYKGNLADRRLSFKGSINKGKKVVCIKFVGRYGADVHCWCAGAERGIAPELLGFQKLPGGWYLVVMELLEKPWELLWELKRYVTFSPSEELKDRLRAALVEMHQNHMVHGDIRDTNIMVDMMSNPPFKLLDFDWAGKVEEVRYPKFVNTEPELRRPEGVGDGKVILPGHDVAMVKSIFETT